MRKRKLLIGLVPLTVAVAACAKAKRQGSEWHGLTESEARAKLDDKLPGKIPADKRSAISDKVVAKMRDHGVIVDDTVPDDASSITDDADELAQH